MKEKGLALQQSFFTTSFHIIDHVFCRLLVSPGVLGNPLTLTTQHQEEDDLKPSTTPGSYYHVFVTMNQPLLTVVRLQGWRRKDHRGVRHSRC